MKILTEDKFVLDCAFLPLNGSNGIADVVLSLLDVILVNSLNGRILLNNVQLAGQLKRQIVRVLSKIGCCC